MARVKLIDPDSDPAHAELAAKIRGQRRGSFLNIYKILLQSPAMCAAWFDFNNAARWQTGWMAASAKYSSSASAI